MYRPSLDGWRAIAIVGVILFHCPILQWGIVSDAWLHEMGGRGVDLFFALSGFLICGRLLEEEARYGEISMRSFYTRRIFRIQPAALTYLAVLSLLILGGEIYKLDRYGASPWSTVITSILMVRNIFTKPFFFETAHFWSLSVEEQFYIFLPTFLVICKRYRLAMLAGLFVAVNVWRVIYLSTPRSADVYHRTDLVCGAILLGCVFALALARPRMDALARAYLRPWVAIVYAMLIFVLTGAHHSRTDYVLIASMYPVLIAATPCIGTPGPRNSWSWLRCDLWVKSHIACTFGRRSFSIHFLRRQRTPFARMGCFAGLARSFVQAPATI